MQEYVSVNTNNRDVQNMDDAVSRVFNSLKSNPLLGNISIVKSQIFTSGADLNVSHKLGKAITGFIVINSNAAANVYQSGTLNIAPTAQVLLKSNANVTADLLFF